MYPKNDTFIIHHISPVKWPYMRNSHGFFSTTFTDLGLIVPGCNMSHGDHEEQTMKLANLAKAYELRPEADQGLWALDLIA